MGGDWGGNAKNPSRGDGLGAYQENGSASYMLTILHAWRPAATGNPAVVQMTVPFVIH